MAILTGLGSFIAMHVGVIRSPRMWPTDLVGDRQCESQCGPVELIHCSRKAIE